MELSRLDYVSEPLHEGLIHLNDTKNQEEVIHHTQIQRFEYLLMDLDSGRWLTWEQALELERNKNV